MKLLCWNINALLPTLRNIDLKHGSLLGFFQFHEADIICFQETKLLPEKLAKEFACVEGYESFWAVSRDKRGYSGVATYVRKTFSPVAAECDSLGSGNSDIDKEGRVVITDHESFVLINVYAPNAGGTSEGRPRAEFKLRFLQALKDRVDQLRATGKQVILVGDLNVAASQRDVHAGCSWEEMYNPEEKAVLQALTEELCDTWRLLHPDTQDVFTVWDEKTNARPFNRGVRIDYALVSKELLPGLVSCEVLSTPPKWSDHAALLLTIQDIAGPQPHAPCPLSSAKVFPAQRSVASLFARKTAATRPLAATAAEAINAASEPPGKKAKVSSVVLSAGQQSSPVAESLAGAAPEPTASCGHRDDASDGVHETTDMLNAAPENRLRECQSGELTSVSPQHTCAAHTASAIAGLPILEDHPPQSLSHAVQLPLGKASNGSQSRQMQSRRQEQKSPRGQQGIRAFFSAQKE